MNWYLVLIGAGLLGLILFGIAVYNDYRDMSDYLSGKRNKK